LIFGAFHQGKAQKDFFGNGLPHTLKVSDWKILVMLFVLEQVFSAELYIYAVDVLYFLHDKGAVRTADGIKATQFIEDKVLVMFHVANLNFQ